MASNNGDVKTSGGCKPTDGCAGSELLFQSLICFFACLMNRPKALSFFRLSRYDIP